MRRKPQDQPETTWHTTAASAEHSGGRSEALGHAEFEGRRSLIKIYVLYTSIRSALCWGKVGAGSQEQGPLPPLTGLPTGPLAGTRTLRLAVIFCEGRRCSKFSLNPRQAEGRGRGLGWSPLHWEVPAPGAGPSHGLLCHLLLFLLFLLDW